MVPARPAQPDLHPRCPQCPQRRLREALLRQGAGLQSFLQREPARAGAPAAQPGGGRGRGRVPLQGGLQEGEDTQQAGQAQCDRWVQVWVINKFVSKTPVSTVEINIHKGSINE